MPTILLHTFTIPCGEKNRSKVSWLTYSVSRRCKAVEATCLITCSSFDNSSTWESFKRMFRSCFTLILDVDECDRGSHNCHLNAVCNNTNGGYNCPCKEGYSGDGHNCTGMSWLYITAYFMLFYVEKWIRFIDFRSAWTNPNQQENKGEIVFSLHALIPVYVKLMAARFSLVVPTILLYTFIIPRREKKWD